MNADEMVLNSLIMMQFPTFVDNDAVSENDLFFDGIHLQENDKRIIANNLINNFNHFLESANLLRWYL